MIKAGLNVKLRNLDITNYGLSGSADDVRSFMGLTAENIMKNVSELL